METLNYYPSKGEGEPANPNQQRQNGGSGGRGKFSWLVGSHAGKGDVTAPA